MVEFKVTRSKKNQSETSITLQKEEVLRILDALLDYRPTERWRKHGGLDPIAEKLYSII